MNKKTAYPTSLFLKMLKEDGVEEVYLASGLPKNQSLPGKAISADQDKSAGSPALLDLQAKALQCTLCKELAAKRKNVVFGSGSTQARLMFVGEAPGHDEDDQGLPFVGQAGQLLTKIIESIGLTREQVYIANVLKCRPPGNRQPQPEEILNCEPYLKRQIELIQPKIICALGAFAAQTLLKTDTPISRLRGKFYDQGNLKVICTYHPAYLLRNPGEKRTVWEDMKMIKKELENFE